MNSISTCKLGNDSKKGTEYLYFLKFYKGQCKKKTTYVNYCGPNLLYHVNFPCGFVTCGKSLTCILFTSGLSLSHTETFLLRIEQIILEVKGLTTLPKQSCLYDYLFICTIDVLYHTIFGWLRN